MLESASFFVRRFFLLVLLCVVSGAQYTHLTDCPHGFVTKSGVPDVEMIRGKTLSKKAKAKSKVNSFISQEMEKKLSFLEFSKFMSTLQSQNLSAAFDGLRCDVHMSHKYKFIYVKHAKSAGSTIWRGFLEPQLCGIRPNFNLPYRERYKVCNRKGIQSDDYWPKDEKTIKHLWRTYTVFTFIRNTFDRAESGYHFVAKHLAPSFERFMDGDELRTKCLEGGCSLHLLRHLAPQSLCTINKYTNTIYADFIGHVENIDADMKTLVNIINSRLDKGVRPLELNMRLSTDNKNPHSLSARLPSLQFARLREKSFGADFDECNSELPTDPQVGDDAAETLQQP